MAIIKLKSRNKDHEINRNILFLVLHFVYRYSNSQYSSEQNKDKINIGFFFEEKKKNQKTKMNETQLSTDADV